MTRSDVLEAAERIVRKEIPAELVEKIIVREDEDWSGDPSLFVDVFLASDAEAPDTDSLAKVRLNLSQGLLDEGERRFAYLRFRDRTGANEEEPIPESPE